MKKETILQKGLERLAKKIGTTASQLREEIYREVDDEYNTQDVVCWLEENAFVYTKKDVPIIVDEYISNYDSERGTWDNIDSALEYLKDDERMSVKFRTKNSYGLRAKRKGKGRI